MISRRDILEHLDKVLRDQKVTPASFDQPDFLFGAPPASSAPSTLPSVENRIPTSIVSPGQGGSQAASDGVPIPRSGPGVSSADHIRMLETERYRMLNLE